MGYLVLFGLFALAGYLVHCARFKKKTCGRCKGTGQRPRKFRRGSLVCSKCGGEGNHDRAGTRLVAAYRAGRARRHP
ncbi:hypothetical protein [Amycolatopsis sp. DSM 110486]|uniref:hypothetical protein n=1 Tax=Amycolatopsis sp. DSM 110486 TaxID=2865832 RepID=UPI001C6A51FB|nr:hypothetical protein [Amycolatopsis sp. DSM 110486]QYN17564.1 hypothetical protein K1T34_32785 [Amycolatopsis sp. DSM 110486]